MYNLYQAVLNAWCVVMFIYEVWTLGMPVWGSTVDTSPKGYRLGFLIWVHYNNKYIELLDTTFMVLRKKNNQISFLHVYHHCLLIWAWFAVCKFAAGGDAYFGALANSFIHVVMYSYYLMSLLVRDFSVHPWRWTHPFAFPPPSPWCFFKENPVPLEEARDQPAAVAVHGLLFPLLLCALRGHLPCVAYFPGDVCNG